MPIVPIVVIDDDNAVLNRFEKGFETVLADTSTLHLSTNESSLLDAVKEKQISGISVLIIDYHISGRPVGFDVANTIKAKIPVGHVMIMSGGVLPENITPLPEGFSFLMKPFPQRVNELCEMVYERHQAFIK